MRDLSNVIAELEQRTLTLIRQYDNLVRENEGLKESLASLQELQVRNVQTIREKEEEIASLKMAQSIQGSNEHKSEATRKINALIREIDWCIAQLSE
jgi:cell shape-determining protein MreC